ncbi:hypothetical protein C8R45DRAFT_907383 [Mycena sanguinolenta]|nr:hypothetical protein C8R45DRAFT_907383 [Mycena sanguinolenta]
MPSSCSVCGAIVISTGDESELNLTTAPRTLARFPQLAATNEPPLETELSVLRPIVEKSSARLASLEAEIVRLNDRLQQLEEERTLLWRYHVQNLTILSPLRRIPPEILGQIFSWTRTRVVLGTENCPWVLTRVCSYWRVVALSKPSLWSLFHIDFSVKQQYSLEMVTTQLERAQSLKIHFFAFQQGDSDTQVALFQVLAKHSERWEELSIQLTSHLVPHMTTLDCNLAALRRAWVQWDTAESQPEDLSAVEFFRFAISLVDIRVYSEYRFLPTRLPILHQLTRYDFDAPWETHSELLKLLPSLQEVRIRPELDDEDWPEPGEPIDLIHLRHLSVIYPAALDYLRAPVLQEISVYSSQSDSIQTCDHLERFLIRSSCSPHRLGIQGALDAQSVRAILQKYPCFTEIVGTDDEVDDPNDQREMLSAFFTLLTISDSTPPAMVLPHIRKIGYASQMASTILCPLFLNMLSSRWNVGECALRAAELAFLSSPAPLLLRSATRIETLREAGLQISLLSGDDACDRVDRWLHRTTWTL